jgi:hypothetical protein
MMLLHRKAITVEQKIDMSDKLVCGDSSISWMAFVYQQILCENY